MFGIGSDDEPLLQQRREVIPVEVNPASDSDRRAKRRRLHGTFGQERQDPLDDRRIDFSWQPRITSQSSALPYMNA